MPTQAEQLSDIKLIELASRSNNERVRDFTKILDQIDTLDDKKKQLWKEIYENAISDRQNAYAMFVQLLAIVQQKSSEHAVHGRTIVSYMERMSRSNDQLIKLADIISRAERAAEAISSEDMFDKIGAG